MPLPISNGESGASARAKINQAFTELAALQGAEPYPVVATYASLPASPAENTTYIVTQSSGVFFINRHPAGFYRYSSGAWLYMGEVPDSYFTDETAVFSDNTDPTKKFKIQLSGITAGATRTLTVPDADGVIARVADLPSAGSITNWNTAFSWGNHASAGYLLPAAIGVSVQGYNVNTVIDAGYVHTDNNFTSALLSKLNGIAAGATANSSDATLLDRANHTGTQLAATISDFNATARAQTEAELVAGANVTITPGGSGATRTLTIAATGGGGGGVSSVAMSVPTGLSVAGSPITSSGTLAVTYAAGYSIPTDANQANWTTAFGWGNHASAGYYAAAGFNADARGQVEAALVAGTNVTITPAGSGASRTLTIAATGGGGGGGITSVNGDTGPVVVLDAADVGALSTSSATTITTTKPTPVPADQIILFDSAVGGNPPALASIGSLLLDTIPDLPPLGLWDYWYWWRAAANGAASSDIFTGAAVSAGTNNTALPTGGMAGYNDHGIFIRSGTTANGGYRYQTSSVVGQYFGAISRKYRCQFLWRTAFTGRTVRMGFHDTSTNADATDGAYFEVLDAVCSAKTANNSTRTTAGTTVTLSLDTAYTFDIDVNAAGTSARFRVYAGNSPTAILDQTITTNIPTTNARTVGAGIVATEATTTASDIGILYGLGVGTVEAFQTRDVAGVLGDINAILASI